MQSQAATVDAYLSEVPPDRQEVLTKLRALCQEELPGYVESMTYGMPCHAIDDKIVVAWASQKNYISLYCLKTSIVAANPELVKGWSCGKSCIRISRPEKVDFERVRKLLRLSFESEEEPC